MVSNICRSFVFASWMFKDDYLTRISVVVWQAVNSFMILIGMLSGWASFGKGSIFILVNLLIGWFVYKYEKIHQEDQNPSQSQSKEGGCEENDDHFKRM